MAWLIGLAIALMLSAGAVAVGYDFGYLPVRPFNATVWRQADGSSDPVRLSMVDWLIGSGQLNGLTHAEVLNLLGPPYRGGYFRNWPLVYWLGPERGFMGIDSEWLAIRFDSNGRVSECRILSD
ncbi:MAG TPA: hypothetical protein VHL34_23715 [Rhizomicrobium sp.]|nr:hypothetical protein [Rhizomicrobium sp.]